MKQSFGEKLKSLFSKSSTINEDFFEELTDREKMVICDHYLANPRIDFHEITKKLGVSYRTTLNLRERALTKLRCHKDELGKYLR